MKYSLAESLRFVCLVTFALGVAVGALPRDPLSGPLFLTGQGAAFRAIGYTWGIVNLLIAGWFFVRPTKGSAWISVAGIAIWLMSGAFVRNVADW